MRIRFIKRSEERKVIETIEFDSTYFVHRIVFANGRIEIVKDTYANLRIPRLTLMAQFTTRGFVAEEELRRINAEKTETNQ